ncbi:O-antigen polymerase [uncultured Tenacibaculum sp.]|uniref:O-antigen polymerase n=1 Tax=uncultured Tenacibaculum sp. TaxID=174713 RepID=UPI002615463A|nr:O-antigen polymerase [uncultured Tenacibaculum sp.]
MDVILSVPLFVSFFLMYKKYKKAYLSLIFLQFVSLFLQPFVGNSTEFDSTKTLLNIIFVNLNLFLIIAPWSYSSFSVVWIEDNNYFLFFKKMLYRVLRLNLVLNVFVLVIVLIYIPDIAAFKAQQAFKDLYESIPYFANIFRYAFVSQNLGYVAIPIFFLHLSRGEYKKSKIALLYASSSLLSGFAFYSRAQIFTFVLIFFIYFFLIKNTLPLFLQRKIGVILKRVSVIIVSLFLLITVVRFSAMDYYSDRIPKNSIIQNPIIYNIVDYASQGYSNGINQLEVYSEEKNLGGEQLFRDVYQILNFVGLKKWDSKESQAMIDKAYNYDGGAFNGYTCYLVFNTGYFITMLISFVFYLVIKFKLKGKRKIPITSLYGIVLLLIIPVVSIFYCGYSLLYFPFLFLLFVKVLYFFKK